MAPPPRDRYRDHRDKDRIPIRATCCCGCCSVRTGTQIIAIIWIVYYVFHTLNLIYGLILYIGDPHVFTKSIGLTPFDPFRPYKSDLEEFAEDHRILAFILLGIGLALSAINLLLSLLLLFGALTDKLRCCVPWFYFNLFVFILYIFLSLFILITSFIFFHFLWSLSFTISFIVGGLLFGYCLWVVYQYIKELRYPMGQQAWLTKAGQFHALRVGAI